MGREVGEDLEGVVEERIMIKIYCMKKVVKEIHSLIGRIIEMHEKNYLF